MNPEELQEAIYRFERGIPELLNARAVLYHLRSNFVNYFSMFGIENMQIDDYVLGVIIPEIGFNFCYGLERQLDRLGNINGSTAFKFGVYYGRTKRDINYEYRFTQSFGATYQEAFENVRNAITDLLTCGENEDIDNIIRNPISTMFKGKILSTYFPERYLNIFSFEHLNYYLTQLDLATPILLKSDPVIKREELIAYKNQNLVMNVWSVDSFATFLWTEILKNHKI